MRDTTDPTMHRLHGDLASRARASFVRLELRDRLLHRAFMLVAEDLAMLQDASSIALATLLVAGCGSDDAGSDDANDGAGSSSSVGDTGAEASSSGTAPAEDGTAESTGAGESSADDSSDSTSGGGVCGEDPIPPGATSCPPECTGGCEAGVCTIACDGFAVCDVQAITCPVDHACVLVCDGGDACDTSTLECADGYACEVQCVDGTDACGDLVVECNAASSCTMNCSDTPTVCEGAQIACGSGECTATCAGGSTPETVCSDACACTPC